MVEPRHTSLGESELDLLKILWQHGAGTVREINAVARQQGRTWAYTTVLTMLQRLVGKGYVTSIKKGIAHVFRPVVSRDHLLRQRLSDLAVELCDGTTTPLVLALVEGRRFSAQEISRFRNLLDELENKQKAGGGRQKSRPS